MNDWICDAVDAVHNFGLRFVDECDEVAGEVRFYLGGEVGSLSVRAGVWLARSQGKFAMAGDADNALAKLVTRLACK